MKNKWLVFLGIVLIILGFVYLLFKPRINSIAPTIPANTIIPTPGFTYAKVTRVYDGDTVQISTGEKVRYIGIDAAEVYPKILCYSEEAKEENEKLVLGKEVKLVKDVSETDKYGRLLRYVYVDDVFVNKELVKNGYAKVMTVYPDIKFESEFVTIEKFAKVNLFGLWGKCSN